MIIPAGPRSRAIELVQALEVYLATCPSGEADFKKIFFNLGRFIRLTRSDKEPSRSRKAEMKWHGVVRDIKDRHLSVLVPRKSGGYHLVSRVHNQFRHKGWSASA
jgi:hypothetical protein